MDTSHTDSIARTRRALMISGLGAALIFGAAAALHGPSLPLYAERFGITLAEASLIVSLQWAGACASVLVLMLGVRMGARWAMALIGSGAALIALGAGWGLTLAGAVLVGAGQGVSSTVFNMRFLNEFGPRGPSFLGLANAFFGLGAILAPLALVALGNDPQTVFAVVAVMAASLWPFARPAPQPPGPAPSPAPLPIWRARWMLIAGAAAVALEAGLAGLGPAALMAGGASQQASAFYASGFFAAFLGSRLALFWLSPYIAPRTLLLGGFVGITVAMAGATLLAAGPFFVLAGAFVGVMFPGYFVLSSTLLGRNTRVASLLIAGGLAGGALGPVMLGGATALAGAAALWPLLCLLALAATLLVALAVGRAAEFARAGG